MDYTQLPAGFSMALAMNPPALNAYAAMTPEQKQSVLAQAGKVKSQKEMADLVNSLGIRYS